MLTNLPRRQREAITCKLAGLTDEQAAQEMSLTVGAVKAHVNLAKKKMIAKLAEDSRSSDCFLDDGEEE